MTSPSSYLAYEVTERDGAFVRNLTTKSIDDLPAGDLLIRVRYSSLNYKDALSATGNKGVTKNYPHTPGIDAAGTVVSTNTDDFKENDPVIVTSYDLGMNTSGGFGQYIRVPADWVVPLPAGLTLQEAMILGTAGLTAGMSVLRLTEHIAPDQGKVVVSGATGGVGALSVAILAKLGYEVAAITGKETAHDFLRDLGAREIIPREEMQAEQKRPLLRTAFAGAVDTVGGPILENIVKAIQPMGVVACCGNVASPQLNLTVFPFILRGVSLIGIDSQNYPMRYRREVWTKLAGPWKPEHLMEVFSEITLEELDERIDLILAGRLQGRTVINLQTE